MRFSVHLVHTGLTIAIALALLPHLEASRVVLAAPECPDLESALTAALGENPDFEIQERASLAAIVRETALKKIPLGIEGADFVISVEPLPDGRYATRLSDARTGAVLQSFLSPPGLEPVYAADWLSLRLRPWGVSGEISRKVSLLGLRFESDSENHRQIERSLNLSLAAALQKSGGTVVLERWKLNDLLLEKELQGDHDGPFWKAANLIDGSISEKDGVLSVRMRERTVGGERILEAQDPVSDLPHLASKLAGLLSSGAQRGETSHEDEAAAYVREAGWLLHHGLKIEAAQAAETAIALGDTSLSTEVLRLRAYAEASYPENLDPMLVQDGNSSYERSDVPAEKLPLCVGLATTVANLSARYAEKHAGMPRSKNRTYEHPTVLCVRTMPFSLSVLRSALKLGFWRENRAAVEDLRDAIKRHIAAVRALPLKHELEWLDNRGAFYRHLIVFAAFWNDTPEETLKFMEHVLSPGFEEECPDGALLARRQLWANGFAPPAIPTPVKGTGKRKKNSPTLSPRLIDWSNLDAGSVDAQWKAYVEAKLNSTDPLVQADGLAFLWGSQATHEEQSSLFPRFIEFLEKHAGDLYGVRGAAIWWQIHLPIQTECQGLGQNENRLRVLNVLEQLLHGQQRLPPILAGAVVDCLPGGPRQMTSGEGQRILNALSAYSGMLGSDASSSELYQIRCARNATLRAFPELAPKPPAHALPVTRAWILSQHTPGDPLKAGRLDEDSGVWNDGRLWFFDADDRKIWKVDPDSFETEVLASAGRPKASHDEKGTSGGNNIGKRNCRPVFAAGKLYLPEQGTIWVLNLRTDTWKALDLPDAHYSLWLAGGKLFASFGERSDTWEKRRGEGAGAYEVNPNDDSARLLFNTRRRPPAHPLDGLMVERPFCMLPEPGGDVTVGFLPGPSFRRLSNGEPLQFIEPKLLAGIVSRQGETLFAHTIYRRVETLRGVQRVTAQGKVETLLWNPECDVPQPAEPVWKYPQEIPGPSEIVASASYRVAMRGEDLILLVSQLGTSPWGASLCDLYLFRRGELEARHIPLAFRLSPQDAECLRKFHQGSESFAYPFLDHYALIPTDDGLAITGRAMPGFWYVPWSDLDGFRALGH